MTTTSRVVITGLIALTAVRMVIGAFGELSPDEAYYYLWADHLAPSYYSKGPGVAWTIKLSTTIFGATAFGIRFFSPLLGLGTSLLLFRLGRSLFDEQTGAWGVVLLNVTPLFNAGSVLMTIDPLSIFFWIAAIFTLWRALHRAAPLNAWWPLTGLMIGLGFLCKYTAAFQLLSILLLLTLSGRWRRQLLKPGFYVLLLVFALCTIPVIVWNAQHDWITVTHLKERGSLDEAFIFNPLNFLAFAGGHFGAYSPIIFAGLVWALVRGVRRFGRDDSEMFLLFFALPIIAVYSALSFNKPGELNWTGPGFVSAGLLLAYYWQNIEISNRLRRNLRSAAVGVAGLMTLITLNTDIARQLGAPWPYSYDFLTRLRGWKESATYADQATHSASAGLDREVFLISNRYQTAATLAFYLPEDTPLLRPTPAHPKIHITESQAIQNQFSFWPRYDGLQPGDKPGDKPDSPFLGRDALYITDEGDRMGPPQNIVNAFETIEIIGVSDIVRRNGLIRRWKVFACYNYHGLPL